MSDTADTDAATNDAAPGGTQAAPRFSVRAQYIKDYSFENPNAPGSLAPSDEKPAINVNVDVGAKPLGGVNYETQLRVTAEAKRGDMILFVVELLYGATISAEHFPAERVEPLCLVEVPRIIFPFARRLIAEATREGGFAPLLIDPVNFAVLYRRKLEARAAEQEASEAAV
jgi:preprotein translocase subunit SecB